jgi:hypothetical protein
MTEMAATARAVDLGKGSNHRDGAIADMREALRLNPSYERAKHALRKLGVEP